MHRSLRWPRAHSPSRTANADNLRRATARRSSGKGRSGQETAPLPFGRRRSWVGLAVVAGEDEATAFLALAKIDVAVWTTSRGHRREPHNASPRRLVVAATLA